MVLFERMVVAGVGLIGGSLGLAARERNLVGEIVGFGRGEDNLKTALRRGAVQRYSLEGAAAARDADLLVLAVPVGAAASVLEVLLPHAAPGVVVIDVGSVKGEVVRTVEPRVAPPASFVGCHPIAGTEHSGAANAVGRLFEGERCILTPTPATNAAALERVKALWEGVGMRVECMAPEVHDRLLALVSHLPHALAYSLVAAVEGERVDGRDPLAYSGGALRDTTRVAGSHPEMWRDIFLANRTEVLQAIERLESRLRELRDTIEDGDGERLRVELARLRAARERLGR
ncbi:MAG: prephenate dehydrogenase [Candidatus Binatia bacterium]